MGPDDLRVKRDDLLGLGGGGNKVRKLEWTVGEAVAAGAETLVTTGAPEQPRPASPRPPRRRAATQAARSRVQRVLQRSQRESSLLPGPAEQYSMLWYTYPYACAIAAAGD
ncbi:MULTISPECIES: hypothetical protein [Amycolatopsis]|uniref:Uncharacterized protein n=1 Tax=Amycolatopsis bullii TaxID=941987 RepID=A0ABQ3K8R6_9PSEU|nr:hypothetical protein [Amycolatopsis bullii]GHG03909.1 hypothetical protein GCM10017567_19830 [Amycolatopsis bullii]